MRTARHPLRLLLPLAAGMMVACDLPLDLPSWDTRWTLVAAVDTVDVDGLLPEGVRFGEDGFVVDSLLSRNHVLLEEVCEFCTCFEGPIPALEITPFDWPVPLPSGIATATLRSGTARIALVNGIGFDLLDSGEGEMGHLEVVLLDLRSGVALDSLHISEPFPPGDTLRASFPLEGLELHRDVVARVRGAIPGSGCDTIPLTPEMGIRTEVELRNVVAGRVEVLLRDADLNLPTRRIDLPAPLSRRLRPGEARVQVEVRLESTVPVAVEGLLSVAGRPEDLYTGQAALYTPLLVPASSGGEVVHLHRTYLLDLSGLEGARSLHLATANRVAGDRRIVVTGAERVGWRVTLHAEVPIR